MFVVKYYKQNEHVSEKMAKSLESHIPCHEEELELKKTHELKKEARLCKHLQIKDFLCA